MDRARIELMAMIYNFGLTFNQQPTQERLEVYADALIPIGAEKVRFAFEKIIRNGNAFFPSLAEIYQAINPKKPDESAIVANEIINLIRIYGPHAETEMMIKASELAKKVLIQIGSTESIRNSENTEIIRAQLERLARALSQKEEFETSTQNIIDHDNRGLKKLAF